MAAGDWQFAGIQPRDGIVVMLVSGGKVDLGGLQAPFAHGDVQAGIVRQFALRAIDRALERSLGFLVALVPKEPVGLFVTFQLCFGGADRFTVASSGG